MKPDEEAKQLVSQHGRSARQILISAIEQAINEENDVEALRLDEILLEVERLLEDL